MAGLAAGMGGHLSYRFADGLVEARVREVEQDAGRRRLGEVV